MGVRFASYRRVFRATILLHARLLMVVIQAAQKAYPASASLQLQSGCANGGKVGISTFP